MQQSPKSPTMDEILESERENEEWVTLPSRFWRRLIPNDQRQLAPLFRPRRAVVTRQTTHSLIADDAMRLASDRANEEWMKLLLRLLPKEIVQYIETYFLPRLPKVRPMIPNDQRQLASIFRPRASNAVVVATTPPVNPSNEGNELRPVMLPFQQRQETPSLKRLRQRKFRQRERSFHSNEARPLIEASQKSSIANAVPRDDNGADVTTTEATAAASDATTTEATAAASDATTTKATAAASDATTTKATAAASDVTTEATAAASDVTMGATAAADDHGDAAASSNSNYATSIVNGTIVKSFDKAKHILLRNIHECAVPHKISYLQQYFNTGLELLQNIESSMADSVRVAVCEAAEMDNKVYKCLASDKRRMQYQCSHCKKGGYTFTCKKGIYKLKKHHACCESCKGRKDGNFGTNYTCNDLVNLVVGDVDIKDMSSLSSKTIRGHLKDYVRGAQENLSDNMIHRVREGLKKVFYGDEKGNALLVPEYAKWLRSKGYKVDVTMVDKKEYIKIFIANRKKEWDADERRKKKKHPKHKVIPFRRSMIDMSQFNDYNDTDQILIGWSYVNPLFTQTPDEGGFPLEGKVAFADAAHARNPQTKGTFFSLNIVNAEHNVIPIGQAWSVFNEGKGTWKSFFTQLPERVRTTLKYLVADGEKGIMSEAKAFFGDTLNYFTCASHRYKRGKAMLSAKESSLFYDMLFTEFNREQIAKMKTMFSQKGKEWIAQLPDEEQFPAYATEFHGFFTQQSAESINQMNSHNCVRFKEPATAFILCVNLEAERHNALRLKYRSRDYVAGGHRDECTAWYQRYANRTEKKVIHLSVQVRKHKREVVAGVVCDPQKKGVRNQVKLDGFGVPKCDCDFPTAYSRICDHGARLVSQKGHKAKEYFDERDSKVACINEYAKINDLPICNTSSLVKTEGVRVPRLGIRRRGRKSKMARTKSSFDVQRKRNKRLKRESVYENTRSRSDVVGSASI